MKDHGNFKKWENQARHFFGDGFWEDIMSVLPEAEQTKENPSFSESAPPKRGVSRTNTPAQPSVDVYKTERQFLVLVDLPGMRNVDNIDVYMHQDQLVISGTVAHTFSQHQTILSERFVGDFKRVIPLPEPIEEEKIQARYLNGVLEIRLPRRPRQKSPKKRIHIQHDPNP